MKRVIVPILLVLSGSAPAFAQSTVNADVEARGEFTDNATLVPEKPVDPTVKKQADQILVANPAIEAKADTRGVKASLRYELNYFHYSKLSKLDRALHDLDAQAALVYWDSLDLDAREILAPQPLSYASPLLDPVNDVQQTRSSAHAGIHHEFGRSTRGSLAYRGEYVTYFDVHKNDPKFPSFLVHGPELTAERDLGPLTTVGLLYSYRIETYDQSKTENTGALDWQGHVAELTARSTPTEWLALGARAGVKAITYTKSKETKTRFVGDADAVAGGEIGRLALQLSDDVTQDVLGNPATLARVGLGADYTPTAPWSAHLGASYGMLELEFPASAVSTVKTKQGFVEGIAGFSYRISPGILTLGAMHHESTTKVDVPGAADSKIVVNRGTLSLGGRF